MALKFAGWIKVSVTTRKGSLRWYRTESDTRLMLRCFQFYPVQLRFSLSGISIHAKHVLCRQYNSDCPLFGCPTCFDVMKLLLLTEILILHSSLGTAMEQLVEALQHKTGDLGFDSSSDIWMFKLPNSSIVTQ
jgi:hypothetical protein